MASRPPRGRGQKAAAGAVPLDLEFGDTPTAGSPLPGTAIRRPVRRVEGAVARSIQSAREGRPPDVRWAAAEALARELGRGIDIAAATGDPYALAQLGPKLLDVLRELSLTPASAQVKGDLEELLADLKDPD